MTDIEYGIDNRGPVEIDNKKTCVFILKTVVHLCFVIYYLSLLSYGFFILHLAFSSDDNDLRFMATFVFAFGTNWNVTFQTLFLLLALSHDALEWMSKQESKVAKKVAYWRDVIFNALVVPFTLFVTTMFWCVFTIDRELVFPKLYDAIIPWWFNHCVHTNIALIVLVETLLTPRRRPTNEMLELKLNSCVAFGYAVVYYSIYFATGRWLYNVFGVMSWWQVCLYQFAIWVSTYIFYFIHFPINRLVHSCCYNEDDSVESKQKINENEELFKKNTDRKENNIEGAFGKTTDIQHKIDGLADTWSMKHKPRREYVENSRL